MFTAVLGANIVRFLIPGLILGLSLVLPCAGQKKCEPVKIPLCTGVWYNDTIFPNILNQTTQEEAAPEVHQFLSLVKARCSDDLAFFLCSVYAPVCTVLETPVPPCRSLCNSAKHGCEDLMNRFGFTWPEKLSCNRFPESGEGIICVEKNRTSERVREIKQLMKTRDTWHKSAKRTNDRLHWNAFKFFRQEVKREIRMAEKAHVRTELHNSKGNTNAIWKIINRCLPRKGAPLKTENPLILSKKFNEFYTSVGKITADKAKQLAQEHSFSSSDRDLMCNSTNFTCANCQEEIFSFSPVTESLVEKIIKGLPSNKAPGADKITSRVLKDSLPVSLPIITNLLNKSFTTNTFARSWKMAEVIPILKSGDFDEPANTRPISLLPILSKVCERLAHGQFVDFLNRSGKISKFQSGNRESHSTETALLHFTDDILKNMDEKKISLIVLLDMSKAFDSIQHERLLTKLQNIGVSTSAWTWFKSYLSQRSQFMRTEDAISDPLPLNYGVPQGSKLGIRFPWT
ncbi:hypothetical protein ACROYT_G042968 [Oculina patagonica]